MKKHLNKSVFSKEEIRQTLLSYRNTTIEHLLNNKNDSYQVDRNDAYGYFGIMPEWGHKIREYLLQVRKQKQRVVYLDICGRAGGRSLGADRSYCFSLLTSDFSKKISGENKILIDGDLFNGYDFCKFINTIKKGRVAPSFVTFMPMAGLHGYNHLFKGQDKVLKNYESITYCLLGKRLKSIVDILRPGGYILLERPFQGIGFADFLMNLPQDKFEYTLMVKKFARQIKCSVEVYSQIGGPYILLRKWLN